MPGFFASVARVAKAVVSSPFRTTSVLIGRKTPREESVKPGFKLAVWAIVLITVGCLAGQIAVAMMWPDPLTLLQSRASDTLAKGWTIGLGALIGLLGGKAS